MKIIVETLINPGQISATWTFSEDGAALALILEDGAHRVTAVMSPQNADTVSKLGIVAGMQQAQVVASKDAPRVVVPRGS